VFCVVFFFWFVVGCVFFFFFLWPFSAGVAAVGLCLILFFFEPRRCLTPWGFALPHVFSCAGWALFAFLVLPPWTFFWALPVSFGFLFRIFPRAFHGGLVF